MIIILFSTHPLLVLFQIICDSDCIIRDVEARWPGSTHDSLMWRHSELCHDVDNGKYQGLQLLGDSGYPCRPNLFTPLLDPKTPGERRYNAAHKNPTMWSNAA